MKATQFKKFVADMTKANCLFDVLEVLNKYFDKSKETKEWNYDFLCTHLENKFSNMTQISGRQEALKFVKYKVAGLCGCDNKQAVSFL